MKRQDENAGSEVWRDMFRIVDLIREQNREDRDAFFFKLTFNQLRMIHRVYVFKCDNGGQGISLKALAERLGITPAAASEMVDTLVKKGVLIRSVDPRDRRAISIEVAEELQMRFRRSEASYDRVTDEFLQTLEEGEREIFLSTLKRWAEYAKNEFIPESGK